MIDLKYIRTFIIVLAVLCFGGCSEMAADQKGDLLNIQGNNLESHHAESNSYFDIYFACFYPTQPRLGSPDLYVEIKSHGSEGHLSRKGLYAIEFDSDLNEQLDHAIILKRRGGDFVINHIDVNSSLEYEVSSLDVHAISIKSDKGIGVTISPQFLASIDINLENFNWRISSEFTDDGVAYRDYLPDSKDGVAQWKTLSMKSLTENLFQRNEYVEFSTRDPRYDIRDLDGRSYGLPLVQSSYSVYDIIALSILRGAREIVIDLYTAGTRASANVEDGSGFFIEIDSDLDGESDCMISIMSIDGKYQASGYRQSDNVNIELERPLVKVIPDGLEAGFEIKIANLVFEELLEINLDRFQWRVSSEFATGSITFYDEVPDGKPGLMKWFVFNE